MGLLPWPLSFLQLFSIQTCHSTVLKASRTVWGPPRYKRFPCHCFFFVRKGFNLLDIPRVLKGRFKQLLIRRLRECGNKGKTGKKQGSDTAGFWLLLKGYKGYTLQCDMYPWDQQVSLLLSLPAVLTLCDPMDCSTPGLPVLHHLLEFTQVHVHCISDVFQPSHPLSPPSPPALNLAQSGSFPMS